MQPFDRLGRCRPGHSRSNEDGLSSCGTLVANRFSRRSPLYSLTPQYWHGLNESEWPYSIKVWELSFNYTGAKCKDLWRLESRKTKNQEVSTMFRNEGDGIIEPTLFRAYHKQLFNWISNRISYRYIWLVTIQDSWLAFMTTTWIILPPKQVMSPKDGRCSARPNRTHNSATRPLCILSRKDFVGVH